MTTEQPIHCSFCAIEQSPDTPLIAGLDGHICESCARLANQVIDVINELKSYNVNVDVYDPWVDPAEAEHEYGVRPIAEPEQGVYDAIVLAVAHNQFRELGARGIRAFGKGNCVLYDVKHILPAGDVDGRL